MARTTRNYQEMGPDGAALPKYFAKSGFVDTDPNKVKKDGHGRGNWGREGDEAEELQDEFNFLHTRRRSNSMSGNHPDIARSKSKFDVDDEVFEE
uniref:ARAD1D44110p n=1 Tax=Blastobotrys adeninivorans TaxID=409370 RepID=A0A060TJ49_BLAAD